MGEGRVQRRIAAILAADVVGYSRLMGKDEETTLATLNGYRAVIDGLIATHIGRVFGSAGDSVIAEFASPVEAVRCATEIQLEINNRNAELPEANRMRFRIGINLGDVVVDGDNLMGDGVNAFRRRVGRNPCLPHLRPHAASDGTHDSGPRLPEASEPRNAARGSPVPRRSARLARSREAGTALGRPRRPWAVPVVPGLASGDARREPQTAGGALLSNS